MRPMCAVALVLACWPLAGCQSDPTEPRYEVMPDMVDAVPGESFGQTAATRDGKTMLPAPPGTLAIGQTRFRYGPGPEEAVRAGQELVSPLADTPEARTRGARVFAAFCTPCHGRGGAGDGPVIPRFPTPPSLLAPNAVGLPDGQLLHIITRGQGLMPSHAAQVDVMDRWKAVLHIRVLQAGGAP